MNTLEDIIKKRKSTIIFQDKPIAESDLKLIFEAARWAPSSFNRQPWRFIVGNKNENQDTYNKLLDILFDGNKVWAIRAPVLILSIAETYMKDRGQENRFAFHDTGMATANLYIQAVSMGLSVHIMGGYDKDKARKVFQIPEYFEPAAMIALGYLGNIDELNEQQKLRKLGDSTRNPFESIVFKESWKLEN